MAKTNATNPSNLPATTVRTAAAEAVTEQYPLLAIDRGELAEMMRENIGALKLDQRSLTRIIWPSGTTLAFTLPGPAGDQIVQHLDGIIVGFRDTRVYWQESYEEGNGAPPDCFSDDLVQGHGTPGIACASCPFAQFGSKPGRRPGEQGRGQACSQRRLLFILRPGNILPVVVSIPPTSVQACHSFFVGLIGEMVPYYGGTVRLGLAKTQNGDGTDYGEATFTLLDKFDPETRKSVRVLKESFAGATAAVRAGDAVTGTTTITPPAAEAAARDVGANAGVVNATVAPPAPNDPPPTKTTAARRGRK